MNTTSTEQANAPTSPIPLAIEALDDAPQYVEHICNTLFSCGQSLRAGDDQKAMSWFARGTSDLGQFLALFSQIEEIAQPRRTLATEAFKRDLTACIHSIEVALTSHDLVSLSDQITSQLVPVLQQWENVAQELHSGFAGQ